MNKQILMDTVVNYMSGTEMNPDFWEPDGKDDLLAFYFRVAKRVITTFKAWKEHLVTFDDFLLSLRDYLLIFDTTIPTYLVEIPDGNPFSIFKNVEEGIYYALFQFPEGVITELAEQAFMRHLSNDKKNRKNYNLMTDSLIYSLTSIQTFKSLSQKLAVYGALKTPDGYTTMVSLPTGGGKSLITQTMAYQSSGLTIVVVPTVSLADDQVIAAKRVIRGHDVDKEIFAYRSGINIVPILDAIRKKTAKLLFISPESLMNNQGFENVIKEANKQHYLKNIIIDEAHIVVDWGASFRVDYQCLEAWRKNIVLSNPSIKTVLLSATYEAKSVEVLKTLFSDEKRWIEVRCDALRHEPRYLLLQEKSFKKKDEKTIELVRKLPHPMIIYVAGPDDAERIKDFLAKNGITNVRTYTGVTNSNQREKILVDWKNDQFQIMVATSAFGVGVDKPDVRTVLHLYIPPNPNAYYQELGRGGRDMLPCLSVMCTYTDDLNITFQRINKRVMTTKKIVGRWDSMYNNKKSIRSGKITHIDTSIKPTYNSIDEWDDSPTSEADMRWNIYVLLLFRRYGLINIVSITNEKGVYIVSIEIVNDQLRNGGDEQTMVIEKIRSEEWDFYNGAYNVMKAAIKNSRQTCWSEMFYDTYDKVDEHCSGCNAHTVMNNSDTLAFDLKVPIKEPVAEVKIDQLAMFESQRELMVISDYRQKAAVVSHLEEMRVSAIIASEQQMLELSFFDKVSPRQNTLIIGWKEAKELLKKGSYYYISGVVAVLYPLDEKEAFEIYKFVSQYLCKKQGIHVVHVLENNLHFSLLHKNINEMIEGRVVEASAFIL